MSARVLHCWKDRLAWIEDVHGHGSDEWCAAYDKPSATCMLEDGHDGPHEFMPDSDIAVSFAPEGP